MLIKCKLRQACIQNDDYIIDNIFNRSCGLAGDCFSDKSACRVIAGTCFHHPYPSGLFLSFTPTPSVGELTSPFNQLAHRRRQEPARHRLYCCRLADVVPARSGLTHVTGWPDNHELPGEIRTGGMANSTAARFASNQLVAYKIQSSATTCPSRYK